MTVTTHRRITQPERERRWRLVDALAEQGKRHGLSDEAIAALLGEPDTKGWERWVLHEHAPVGARLASVQHVLTLLHDNPVGTSFASPAVTKARVITPQEERTRLAIKEANEKAKKQQEEAARALQNDALRGLGSIGGSLAGALGGAGAPIFQQAVPYPVKSSPARPFAIGLACGAVLFAAALALLSLVPA